MRTAILPGFYLFHSRLRARWEQISWFLIHPVVAGFIGCWSSGLPAHEALPLMIGGFLAWLSIYEIGYIENDMAAAREGDRHGQRLTESEIGDLSRDFRLITTCKWLVTGILVFSVWAVAAELAIRVTVGRFVCILLAARALFVLHNFVHGRWKILTFFSLYLLKYTALALLFPVDMSWKLVTIAAVVVPLPRVMEYSAKEKFGFARWRDFVGNLDRFRLGYYAIGFGVCILLVAVWRCAPMLLTSLIAYMLLLRAAAFFCATRLQIRARA